MDFAGEGQSVKHGCLMLEVKYIFHLKSKLAATELGRSCNSMEDLVLIQMWNQYHHLIISTHLSNAQQCDYPI